MNMIPMPDTGWVSMMIIVGMYGMVIIIPFTILIEGLIIQRFLNLTFWHGIKDAVIVNIISALLGVVYLTLTAPSIGGVGSDSNLYLGASYYEPTPEAFMAVLWLALGIPYLVSVVVEGLLLVGLERDKPWNLSLLSAFLGNSASYLGMLFYILWSFRKFYSG